MDKVTVILNGHPRDTKVFAGGEDISRFISRVEIVIDVEKQEASVLLTCPFPEVHVDSQLLELISHDGEWVVTDDERGRRRRRVCGQRMDVWERPETSEAK